MEVKWTSNAGKDFAYWKQHDLTKVLRIQKLILDIHAHPFTGIGKPEPLRYGLAGMWSRRITKEHRLIYAIQDNTVIIYACRFHYQ